MSIQWGAWMRFDFTAVIDRGIIPAVGNSSFSTMLGRRNALQALNCDIATVFIGANDLGPPTTAQGRFDELMSYVEPIRARGTKVLVATNLPIYISGNTTYTNHHNTVKAGLATLLRAEVGKRIYGVIDFEANATIGPAAAAENTALYSDGQHPTTRNGTNAGHDYMYTIFKNKIEPLIP